MRKKERAPRRKVMLKNLCLIFGAAALVASTPLSAAPRGDEPVAVPSSVKQGIDFVYVDPEMSNVAKKQKPRNWLQRIFGGSREQSSPNPLFLDLAQGLQRYQATWGALPDVTVSAGPVLKRGSKGKRVDLLRTRLGLSPGGGFDDVLFQRVSEYQRVHGLGTPDGIVGKVTLASLTRGAEHYAGQMARTVLQRIHNPGNRQCGCDPECWCRTTTWGRALKWWLPPKLGIHHKNEASGAA